MSDTVIRELSFYIDTKLYDMLSPNVQMESGRYCSANINKYRGWEGGGNERANSAREPSFAQFLPAITDRLGA